MFKPEFVEKYKALALGAQHLYAEFHKDGLTEDEQLALIGYMLEAERKHQAETLVNKITGGLFGG